MKKNDFLEIDVKGIKIDVRSSSSLYVKIGKWIVYLDDGTRERIITEWYDNGKSSCHAKKQRKF